MKLPEPRGPLSASLFDYLVSGGTPPDPLAGGDPLTDHDFQLALYCALELHYGGIEGVDDDREWDPPVATLRATLGNRMLDRIAVVLPAEPAPDPGRIPEAIFAAVKADDAPPLSRFVERTADLDQFREFLMHRSAYQLKEADPHTFGIPRISGAAKAAMVEIQADEYGGGQLDRMHSQLFAKTMAELGLDPAPGAYVGRLPATTLATVNLISVLGLSRRWRGALVGHLAGFEITSPGPNRRYGNGLRRLGYGPDATEFFDEHVEADSVHENVAAYDLAGGLARQEPELAAQIMFGVRALLRCERAFAAHILGHWEAGSSSLLELSEAVA
jgi:hypothetical protein